MKKILFLSIFSLSFLFLQAQDFQLPEDYTLEEKEDYSKYEADVLKAIDWLKDNPVNEDKAYRKKVNAFVLKWAMGSPTVSIMIRPNVVPYSDNSDLLLTFLGGWVKYSIENNHSKDDDACAYAGTLHVLEFYKKNKKEIGKQKDLEKFIKKESKGKLEKYIARQM